ncbi:MAG: Uma2 family endonuclease [bacterium]|nr:Uma2 family endonuclease [bacterium]
MDSEIDPTAFDLDDDPGDPFYYGWRYLDESESDGSDPLHRVPLTYSDLLSPEVGDFIAEDTVHRSVVEGVARILKPRLEIDPEVAVWSDLKIYFVIPGVTTGPGPDISVVTGVRDRERRRRSFRLGKEPGRLALAIEVVSNKSMPKDYRDILDIYDRMEVGEYIAIRPTGHYADGPFELRGWRRSAERLRPLRPDDQGRLRSEIAGVLFGTGEGGSGLVLWDAVTGERLLTAEERERLRAERAESEIEQLRARLGERDRATE